MTRNEIIDKSMRALSRSVTSILADPDCNKTRAMATTFTQFRNFLQSNVVKLAPPNDPEPDDDDDEPDDTTALPPKLQQAIAALITAHPQFDTQSAADFLINTPHGRALSNHLAKKEVSPMTTRTDEMRVMRDFAKQAGGMQSIAKHIIEKGTTTLTEHEFTSCLQEHAALNKLAGESDGAAFSRIFSAPESVDIRRAHQISKSTLAPRMSIELVQPTAATVSDADSAKAYAELQKRAALLRAAAPQLSEAQAFAKAFTEHPDLAARAHRRPTATTSYAFPS
jgi:hypothetical protein